MRCWMIEDLYRRIAFLYGSGGKLESSLTGGAVKIGTQKAENGGVHHISLLAFW